MENNCFFSSKIIDAEAASRIARTFDLFGKKVIFTNGCFDILHRGHVEYLAHARNLGDCLMVGLNTDESVKRLNKGPGRPLNKLSDRAAVLASLMQVDYVIPFDEDTPEDLIKKIRPRILVKGGDYRPEQVAGKGIVESYGGSVQIIPFTDGLSTTLLIEKIKKLFS